MSRDDDRSCGRRDADVRADDAARIRKHVRPIRTPKARLWRSPSPAMDSVVEVTLKRHGHRPVHAVVGRDHDTAATLETLERQLTDLPRLPVDKSSGALDVMLEAPERGQVKAGTVLLTSLDWKGDSQTIALDPNTRRFRAGGLPAGRYRIQAASAPHGRATREVEIRAGDVRRLRLALDGRKRGGKRSVRFLVRGTRKRSLHARVLDKDTGKLAFEGNVKLVAGVATFEALSPGRFHFEFDDGNAKSCYDADVDDAKLDLSHLKDLQVRLEPYFPHGPLVDPKEPFSGLGEGLSEVGRILPKLGVRSIEDLAREEPEGLVHRARNLGAESELPSAARVARAVTMAREWTGASPSEGKSVLPIALSVGTSAHRALRSRIPGKATARVFLRKGTSARLVVEGETGRKEHAVKNGDMVEFDTLGGDAIERIRIENDGDESLFGHMELFLPGPLTALTPTPQDSIDSILSHLAPVNPGLNSAQPAVALNEGNIRARLDRARSLMREAGVCSLNDLGRLRIDPARKFTSGLYVAPKRTDPGSLSAWAFSELLNEHVLHYVPNDMVHQSAVICADTWDIRGQTIIIAPDVRDFLIIARRIEHDAASRITWEQPNLPSAGSYWPSPAPAGANGVAWGEDGAPGTNGDQDPPPSKNGGSNAVIDAPNIEAWVLETTNGLPAIDLGGQDGATGGTGQAGGRGGDGQCGRRAEGHVFTGCCREVGHGGDGGRGGNGGRGGRGGTGGRGGQFILMTAAEGLAVLASTPPAIDVGPGDGGGGGPGGTPGGGGTGGPPGTANCEPWCDERPERRGSNGSAGSSGPTGFSGSRGPDAAGNAVQFFPVTEEEWEQALNNPHILEVLPLIVCPGDTVSIRGVNFDTTVDRVFFDGAEMGGVSSSTEASFTVPLDSEGSWHPVVVRDPSDPDRRSNRVMIQVLPVLNELPDVGRWTEGSSITLTGLAIQAGAVVVAEDWSASPVKSWILPVGATTRTSIVVNVPPAPLADLRGVRRIKIRNPDAGESKEERVARLSETIVVRVAAFRVVDSSGDGTLRTAAEITDFLTEGTFFSVSTPWGAADIAFELVQPVADLVVDPDLAQLWPTLDNTEDTNAYANAPGVDGALNLFFVRDVALSTAYMYFGGGPSFIGDEGSKLGPIDFQQVIAHEIGHGLCLRHICDGGSEGPGTFFDRLCQDGDEQFLMYPFWDTADGMAIDPGQIPIARSAATHFETGKTAALTATDLFNLSVGGAPACQGDDTEN